MKSGYNMWGAAIAGAAAAYDTLSRDDRNGERHSYDRSWNRRVVTPEDRARLNASGFDIIVTEDEPMPGLRRCRYNLVKKAKSSPSPEYKIWCTAKGTGNVSLCTDVKCTFLRVVEQIRYLTHMHQHHMFWYEEVD